MKRVIIESPYAGDVKKNLKYLGRAVKDCLIRGESPYASHAFFTQFLDDTIPEERELGIAAGLAWANVVDTVVVYTDLGISSGMEYGVEMHHNFGRKVEFRSIGVDDTDGQ